MAMKTLLFCFSFGLLFQNPLTTEEPPVKPLQTYILKEMQERNIQGLSLAIIDEDQIAWVHGFGHIGDDPKSALVDEHTLFQAASLSKPLTAFGALILVSQGKISLDDDVNKHLKRWKVPENAFTKTEKVTLRRLLTHTAGITVDGFPGYASDANLPLLVEVLEGKKPKVNTDPVIVASIPGTEMKYSGGGTTIVQLLIEDITGIPFDVWMRDNVLQPLGMEESTFLQPLTSQLALHAAYGHHANGSLTDGKWHVYPEMAAAGLWTTPQDLAKFVLYFQSALSGEKTKPLPQYYVKEMLERQKAGGKPLDEGLGLFLQNQGKDLMFTHAGQNEGFISRLIGFPYLGKGVVIMMNNDSGNPLMQGLTIKIEALYDWPKIK